MADDIAIRIRDQIATQITATSYGIYTARHFALEEGALPAVCIALGDDTIEEADFDRTEIHEHDYKLRVYGSSSGDVDKVVRNTIGTILALLKSDPQLGGLADDSFPVSIGEPEREEGSTKFLLSEVVYRVIYQV